MKKALFFLLACISFSTHAQNFGIPVKVHPYYGIIEWKGQGGILLSRSPKDFLNQIGMSLVGELEQGKWDQKFNPKIRDPYYLCAENTRYVYFIDNLDPINNGNLTFNQINMAGNIKSTTLDIGAKVKLLPDAHDYNKFELMDAAVTDKALVYLYRYLNKKDKEYYDFAVFMTHHNMQCIVFQLSKGVDQDLIKNETNGQWQFSGFEGGMVYLSWRAQKTDINGFVIKGFNPKGEMEEDSFVFDPENARKFLNTGYGTTGKNYITDETRFTKETGIVSYMNGQFYFTCILEEDGTNKLVLMEREDDHWITVNSVPVGDIDENTDKVRLGASPVKEGIVYHYKHNGTDKAGILLFEKGKQGMQEDYTAQSVYNPSRFLLEHKPEEFITHVMGKILTCNMTQFNNSGAGIQFQHH